MDKLSLTYFVDFVVKAGTPKLTIVRQFKDREEYEPWIDFYKPLREAIVDMHATGKQKTTLDAIKAQLKDIKKLTAYPPLISGYKKFLGKKATAWFTPPSTVWTASGVDVMINPEIGLDIVGIRHVIKLYFKKEKLTKVRADLITHLMADALAGAAAGATFGVLDIRNAKLFTATTTTPALQPLLLGEAAAFAAMFSNLP